MGSPLPKIESLSTLFASSAEAVAAVDRELLEGILAKNSAELLPEELDYLRQLANFLQSLETTGPGGREFKRWSRTFAAYFPAPIPEQSPSMAQSPSVAQVEAFISDQLELEKNAVLKSTYDSLSPLAREGIYLLLLQGISVESLGCFLSNRVFLRTETTVSGVLERMVHLYDHGVKGFEQAFVPTVRDKKLLSDEAQRIESMMSELFQALLLASVSPDVASVHLSHRLAIDWQQLTAPEREFIQDQLLADLPEDLRKTFQRQQEVEVDVFVYGKTPHKHWLVEVKRSAKIYQPQGEELAKNLLQVIRQALLVRQHDLAGLEYVIEAEAVHGDYLSKLVEVLELSGVPYLIRVEGDKEKRQVISGGLSYQKVQGIKSQTRTRPLPPRPKELVEKTGREAGGNTAKAPWTREMRDFLDEMMAGTGLNVKKLKSVGQFYTLVRKHLRIADQDKLIEGLRAKLAELPNQTQILQELEAFKAGREQTLAQHSIQHLVNIAQLATEQELETEESESTPYSQDLLQALAHQQAEVENTLQDIIVGLGSNLEAVQAMMQDGVSTIFEHGELVDLLGESNPDLIIGYKRNGDEFNLRRMVALLADPKSQINWDETLQHRLAELIQNYDGLAEPLVALGKTLPPETPQAIEKFYRELPRDALRNLRGKILEMGELPSRRVKKKGERKTTQPKQQEYTEARVMSLFNTLILVRVEGDATRAYYYPEDLQRIEQLVLNYLRDCGWNQTQTETEFPKLKQKALGDLSESYGVLGALSEIITDNFTRTDKIDARDPFSEEKLDVTEVVTRLWKQHAEKNLHDLIRVVVMADGRKVYFADWDQLKAGFGEELWQLPNYRALTKIMAGGSTRLEAFFKALAKYRGVELAPGADGVVSLVGQKVRSDKGARVYGLRLVDSGKKTPGTLFNLVFVRIANKYFIRSLKGSDALELGLAYLKTVRGAVIENRVEIAVLVRTWLPKDQSRTIYKQGLLWQDLLDYLGQTGFIKKIWKLLRLANPELEENPEHGLRLFGRTEGSGNGRRVTGLSLVARKEADKDPSKKYFNLSVARLGDEYFIKSLKGVSALELGLSYLSVLRGSIIENVVEISALASAWGTKNQSKDATADFHWQDLLDYLGQAGSIKKLWKLLRLANPELEEVPELVSLIGLIRGSGKDSRVIGLRLFAGQVNDKYPHVYFNLSFARLGDEYFIKSLKGVSALELGLSYLSVLRGSIIENVVEISALASAWGTINQSKDATARFHWQDLLDYIGQAGAIKKLWKLLRLANPELEEMPELVSLIGSKRGTGIAAGVSALRLIAEKEDTLDSYFNLSFVRKGEDYVLENKSGRGSPELASLFNRKEISGGTGNPFSEHNIGQTHEERVRLAKDMLGASDPEGRYGEDAHRAREFLQRQGLKVGLAKRTTTKPLPSIPSQREGNLLALPLISSQREGSSLKSSPQSLKKITVVSRARIRTPLNSPHLLGLSRVRILRNVVTGK